MFLRFLAFIYRHTGIYLGYFHELLHIASRDTVARIVANYEDNGNDEELNFLIDLEIAMWQVKHGFSRPFKFTKEKVHIKDFGKRLLKK